MLKRIITSIVALLIFLPFLVFSSSPSFVFVIATTFLSVVSVYEIAKCTSMIKHPVILIIPFLASLGSSALARYIKIENGFFDYSLIILFVLFFSVFAISTFSKGKISIADASVFASMCFYVIISFSMLILLRDFEIDGTNVGGKIYLLAFLFAWMPDIGGYFTGRFFGKHKLIPDVSPKKTVEGFFGGMVFSFVSGIVYCLIIGANTEGFILILSASLICSVVSVCGDLIASKVKRYYDVKDYGFIFPGHGGVMDRFDSVLAVIPVLFIICYLSSKFGIITSPIF